LKGELKTSNKDKTLTEKLADSHYQPTKAELEQEYDMPGMSEKEVRKAFFNPVAPGRPKLDRA